MYLVSKRKIEHRIKTVGAHALRWRTPPPRSSPRSPLVNSKRASLSRKQAPFHPIVPFWGATEPTNDGSRSTALWRLLSTGHDTCRGRTGSKSFTLSGTFSGSATGRQPNPNPRRNNPKARNGQGLPRRRPSIFKEQRLLPPLSGRRGGDRPASSDRPVSPTAPVKGRAAGRGNRERGSERLNTAGKQI